MILSSIVFAIMFLCIVGLSILHVFDVGLIEEMNTKINSLKKELASERFKLYNIQKAIEGEK